MEKFEVKTGEILMPVLGITNYQELQTILGEKTVSEIVVSNSTDKKDVLESVKHYKAIRTPLTKARAEANKLLKSKSKEILDQFDEAKELVSSYIEPYETAVNEYDEKNRLAKLEKKKAIFVPQIIEANLSIIAINEEYGQDLIELIEWQDDFVNMKDEKVKVILEDAVEKAINKKKEIDNNILAIEITAKSLKLEYDLQSDLNFKLILGNKIYSEGLFELQQTLEEFAADQQEKEIEAAERAEAAEKRKAELEAERVKKEAEAKQKAELEKARVEEREKIEKEEQAKKPDPLPENYYKEPIKQEIEQKIEQHNENPIKTQAKTLYFPELTKQQANDMCKYFNEHNIKFKAIK